MSNEETPDGQIGEALLIRVIQDQMLHIITKGNVSVPHFPESQPLPNEQCEKLLDQLSKSINMIADQLSREQTLNNQINSLARMGDKKIFFKLVEGIFRDGEISWGRIIVLFYLVGKLAVKMVLANLSTEFSSILDSCLDFFRTKLLIWIRKMGGWMSSISALTQFSVEHVSTSASSFLSTKVSVAFICGIILGSTVVWKFSNSS